MDIIKPDTPKIESYKLGEFEMTTDQPPIKALARARDMAERLMQSQGNFGPLENPFHLEPAAQYVFMMAAQKIADLEARIEELEKADRPSSFTETAV